MENEINRRPLLKRRGLTVGMAAGILVLSILIAVFGLSIFKSSRNKPISVDIYPDAQLIETKNADQYDVQVYSTTDSVQQVLDFYTMRQPKL